MMRRLFATGVFCSRERRLLFVDAPSSGPDVPVSGESLPPLERGNISQYFFQMLTAVSRMFSTSSFRGQYGQWGQPGMQQHLDGFLESRGYGPGMPYGPGAMPYGPGGYPMTPRRGRRLRPGYARTRPSGSRERVPGSGVLHSVEIRDETPRFGVRIAEGGTNTDIIINTADLTTTPPNGNDLLRTHGIRVVYFPVGGRNGFRVEFTRPGSYGVGRLTGTTMNWSVIALSASPSIGPRRPSGRPSEVATLPSVEPIPTTAPSGVTFETLPNGLRRPTLGTESTRWRNDVTRIASALQTEGAVRERLTIRPALKTELLRYVGSNGGITFEHSATAPAGQQFTFVVGGERWFITERSLISADTGRFSPDNCTLVIRKQSDPLAQRAVPQRTLFPAGNRFSVTEVQTAIREANARRENERSDPAGVARFDLPRDRDVGYVGICDNDGFDRLHLSHFPAILNGHGYRMVTTGEWATAIDRQNPMGVVLAQITAMHAKGIRSFMVDLYPHGTESAMEFSNGQKIRPADIRALVNRFPDSTFLIRSNACYAGGLESMDLRDAFSGDDEASRRLTIVYQVTDRTPNRVIYTRSGDRNSLISTYDAILIQYMQANPGCTLGAAMRHADLRTKELYPGADAGVIRSGRTGDVRTVRSDTPRRDPLMSGDGGRGGEAMA